MSNDGDWLSDIPATQAKLRGASVAVAFEGRTLTYAELDRRADRVAAILREMGQGTGARIAWLGRSTETWYEIFFGTVRARTCFTPINARLAVPEIAFILKDSTAEVLFVTPELFEAAESVLAEIGRPMRVIAVGGTHPEFEDYATLLETTPPCPQLPQDTSDDILQLYTSGTTGLPKGVCLSNANYRAFLGVRTLMEGFAYETGEGVLIVMPLFHVAGVNVSLAALAAGACITLAADFKSSEVLGLIARERVAHAFFAPAMINMLLQDPLAPTTDLSSMRTISYGASPIAQSVLEEAQRRFNCGFIQYYGMTETTGAGTTLEAGEHSGALLRSCGRPWPTLEVRIADFEGQESPPGQIGQIEIRGPMIMRGYWNRAEATAETIRPDGWLQTGDMGVVDEAGFFYVQDRVKDMIVTGGENVYPAEVENALLSCPGVADAAVIGVPDPKWGEAVKAIVVRAPGEDPTHSDLIDWVRQRIAGYKAPKSIDFVDTLPRNASGKILRRQLRDPYWEAHGRKIG